MMLLTVLLLLRPLGRYSWRPTRHPSHDGAAVGLDFRSIRMLPNATPETRRRTRKRIAAAIIVAAVLLVLAIAPGLRSNKFQPAIDPYPAPYSSDAVSDGSEP